MNNDPPSREELDAANALLEQKRQAAQHYQEARRARANKRLGHPMAATNKDQTDPRRPTETTVASPSSPTVVNAEITKLAINDDAPCTRATTPETVASNRAPSVVPSTASTGTSSDPLPSSILFSRTIPPRNSNGTSRARKPSGSVPTPLVDPALPPLPPPPTYAEIPPPSKPGGRAIQPVLHPDELQQGVATDVRNLSSHEAIQAYLWHCQADFRKLLRLRNLENTLIRTNGWNPMNLTVQDFLRPPPPPPVQAQAQRSRASRPRAAIKTPTTHETQDSPSGTQHAEPSGRTLSRIGTEIPPSEPLESLPEEPSGNELSLNSHWKQYLRAVHEQCVVGFQNLEDYSLAEIKIRLSDVENKLDQLHVVIPQNHADVSGQISRYLNRVKRMFEDSKDSVSKLHNKVTPRSKIARASPRQRALLEAQFNTFQDILSRVKAQSVHASLTLNTLEAKLVSCMEHQLQGIQTSITGNCLNSNAHTACHKHLVK
ncbi:hypothetical protein H4Q26_013623 [Puccinia striiformis f. sp. tritici PST-130]|nr:hypothetical protein H4Q26_013623 [Puccinia striiformis f. sp. tritici PST-130]